MGNKLLPLLVAYNNLTVDCFALEMADILAHRVGKSSLARVVASLRDQRA
jgi:hypothetical protein